MITVQAPDLWLDWGGNDRTLVICGYGMLREG